MCFEQIGNTVEFECCFFPVDSLELCREKKCRSLFPGNRTFFELFHLCGFRIRPIRITRGRLKLFGNRSLICVFFSGENYEEKIQEWDKSHPGEEKVTTSVKSKTKFQVLKSNITCDSTTPKISGNVYWAVFAGRRKRLEVQEKFWHYLYKAGLITEVHLWDFTSFDFGNHQEGKLNKEWVEKKTKEYDFIKLIEAKHGKDCYTNGRLCFLDFYEHYSENLGQDDVVLKVDDDILWVNVSEFKCFVKYVQESKDTVVVSANVVNNNVIAHIQQQLGMIPENVSHFDYPEGGYTGRMFHSPQMGLELHKYFVSNKHMFYREGIVRYFERCAINFLGWNYWHAKDVYHLVKYAYEHGDKFLGSKDEAAITTFANTELGGKEVVNLRFVVAHGAFAGQWVRSWQMLWEVLQLYGNETIT